jgi:type I restriction enzyme S subunit
MGADVSRDGRYVTPCIDFLTEEGAKLSRPMPAGTLTLVCSGDVGTPSFLAVDACIHDGFLALTHISQEVNADYLYEVLSSFKTRLERSATHGGVFTNLTTDILRDFSFVLPPLKAQEAIASVLRAWDEAIEFHDGLIARFEKQHAALIRSLVFGRIRLAHYSNFEQVRKYRWFDLPTDWQCKRISRLAQEVSERNREDGNAEILSCSKYDGFVRSLDYFKKQVFSSDLTGYKRIYRGDFGFPSNHVEEGSIGLQNLTDIGLVSPIYTVFRFSGEKVDNEYAYYVLKTGLYRHIFEVSTSASVDRRGSLRWDEFGTIPFPVPSFEEQQEIVKVLNTSAKRIAALRKERSLLERQKRGLMQKLLTGKWRVKVERGAL